MAFVRVRWGGVASWTYAAQLPNGHWVAGICGRPRLPALTFVTRADAVAAAERLAVQHRYPRVDELATWAGLVPAT